MRDVPAAWILNAILIVFLVGVGVMVISLSALVLHEAAKTWGLI